MKAVERILILGGLLLAPAFAGCSLVNQVALDTTSEILADASPELETEHNWQRFRISVPALLKTMEALWYNSPKNNDLLVSLTKGYSAYGFGVYETLALQETLGDTDHKPYLQQALDYYSRAIDYGLRFLKTNDITVEQLADAIKNGNGASYLDNHLDQDNNTHVEGVFFLGFTWLSFANLQRDNPSLVSQVYIVKGLIDWACTAQPNMRDGLCKLMNAAYETSRPKMLGGNPAKGAKIFRQAIKDHPNNHMIRLAYIQYSLIPSMDDDGYKEQKEALSKIFDKDYEPAVPGANVSLKSRSQSNQLFNAIAKRRFVIIKKFEKDIFE